VLGVIESMLDVPRLDTAVAATETLVIGESSGAASSALADGAAAAEISFDDFHTLAMADASVWPARAARSRLAADRLSRVFRKPCHTP
jgi:hypothetical protein